MGVACGGCDRFGQVKRSVSDLHWFAWEWICLVALSVCKPIHYSLLFCSGSAVYVALSFVW